MEPFATKEQYDARFPGRSASDEMLAECLTDATTAICVALDEHGIDYSEPSEEFGRRLMTVCRSMANRILPSGSDLPMGVTQASVTAGPYTQSMSFSSGYGTPKPLPSELSILGIGGSKVGWAPLGGRDD